MKHEILSIKSIGITSLIIVFLFLNLSRSFSQDNKEIKELDLEVWTIQAVSVALDLELKKKTQTKLTKSYHEFRIENSDYSLEQQEAFAVNLQEFLSSEQAEQAGFQLGSLNNRWDQYLELLLGFGLEEEVMDQSALAVYEYIGKYLVERKKAADANARFSGRISTALKQDLDGKISGLLSEEQIAYWLPAKRGKIPIT